MKFVEPQWLERVTSTNTIVLERLAAGEVLANGFVLAATEQSAGRGRGTHQWLAHPGRDLCCSFVCRTRAPARQLASVAMATALGIVDCLAGYGVAAGTKWPNDVVVPGATNTGGAKIAGILCEPIDGAAVIGIGLNVSMSATEARQIDQHATSILIETGTVVAPRDVLPRLLTALAPRLHAWHKGGFAHLRQDWASHCLGLGQQVVIEDGDLQHRGRLQGFGDAGQLLLAEESTITEIWTGHLRFA